MSTTGSVGYARSEDLLDELVKQLTIPSQVSSLEPATMQVLEEACWHLYRQKIAAVKKATEVMR